MFSTAPTFGGFSTDDLAAARAFYGDVLGLPITDTPMGIIEVGLAGDTHVIIYEKDDHVPATYTVLNFVVDDIDAAVDALAQKGVDLERYEGSHQDERGISRGRSAGMGPDIAWFTDPAGNILSVLQN
jgi:catechol 2,3-dioxygenase-like lactoylglutathione lyase family enzyme